MGKHEKKETCTGCNGKGEIEQVFDGKKVEVTCPLCDGTGEVP